MNEAFWNSFTSDYTANCLAWKRYEHPVLPPEGDGWKSRWTANPDIIEFNGKRLMYYRGSGELPTREGLRNRIGGLELTKLGPGSLEFNELNGGDFLIDVGPEGAFDGTDILDPAAVVFNGRLWLYYSAIGPDTDSVGLAVSDDGIHFEKLGKVITGRAPEVVAKDGRIFMTYQQARDDGSYQLFLVSSTDGVTFQPVVDHPIFPRQEGSWDALSLVTGRISESEHVYYMIYGGSAYLADEPDFFGLARSTDLIHWEPHPGNPIFGCGRKGAADGGAMWFPALVETSEAWVILFEGSRGKYSWDVSSAICMAWLPKN